MSKVTGLFPTPFLKADRLVAQDLLRALEQRAGTVATELNARNDQLSHTEMADPAGDPLFQRLAREIQPQVEEFGTLLFGEPLPWLVKEMWLNVLEPQGSQFMHTHANSFISGIVYVNEPHESSRTVFRRTRGGEEYIFRHDGIAEHQNPFNTETWVLPEADPGDLVLYPSYLLHGVPPNQGGQRITVALNAVPAKLKSFGYEIRFSR